MNNTLEGFLIFFLCVILINTYHIASVVKVWTSYFLLRWSFNKQHKAEMARLQKEIDKASAEIEAHKLTEGKT